MHEHKSGEHEEVEDDKNRLLALEGRQVRRQKRRLMRELFQHVRTQDTASCRPARIVIAREINEHQDGEER